LVGGCSDFKLGRGVQTRTPVGEKLGAADCNMAVGSRRHGNPGSRKKGPWKFFTRGKGLGGIHPILLGDYDKGKRGQRGVMDGRKNLIDLGRS